MNIGVQFSQPPAPIPTETSLPPSQADSSGDSRPALIVGAGGYARVLIEAIMQSGAVILGCVAKDDPARPLPVPFLGDDEAVFRYAPRDIVLINGVGSTSRPDARREVFRRYKRKGYRFGVVVHPSAILPADVSICEGAQVMAGAVLQPGCRIGDDCIVNTGVVVDHDCQIGDHVHLAPGVVLSGGVTVGEGSHIGTGARVIHGVRIGAGVVVGAGAVVLGDVPSGVVVAGVPARPLSDIGTSCGVKQ